MCCPELKNEMFSVWRSHDFRYEPLGTVAQTESYFPISIRWQLWSRYATWDSSPLESVFIKLKLFSQFLGFHCCEAFWSCNFYPRWLWFTPLGSSCTIEGASKQRLRIMLVITEPSQASAPQTWPFCLLKVFYNDPCKAQFTLEETVGKA
jgi:hypothetical protein